MQRYAYVFANEATEIPLTGTFEVRGQTLPVEILTGMSAPELLRLNVFPIIEPPEPAPGMVLTILGTLSVSMNFEVTRDHTLEPESLEIAKLRITSLIDKKRDSLIDSGFEHDGHLFQSQASDRENIGNLGILAMLKVAGGAQVGDLRWLTPDSDFRFITATNEQIDMDAHQMAALYNRGLSFKSALTFYARYLKDAVKSAGSHEALAAVPWGVGWPT